MVRRRCLGCPAMIPTGSYCEDCRQQRERERPQRRSGYSRNGWARAVKIRDGFRCRVRDCATPYDRVEAHHVRALALGGPDTVENGITLCHRHHLAAHEGNHGRPATKAG